jgi:hypothetical protein
MLLEEDKDDPVQEEKGPSVTDIFLDKLRRERTTFVRLISSKPDRVVFSVNHTGLPGKKDKKIKFKKRR